MAKTETKAEKFTQLAEKRVTAALKAIRLIGNLASSNYERTDDQVATIKVALENGIAEMEGRFEQPYSQEHPDFRFDNYDVPDAPDDDNDDDT